MKEAAKYGKQIYMHLFVTVIEGIIQVATFLIQAAISLIGANIALAGNHSSAVMSHSISDLMILKSFNIDGHPGPAPKIIQVNWSPPLVNMIKCNTDGASRGNPGAASCGGIFRDYSAAVLGCFSATIGVATAFQAELHGTMIAIEVAYKK